MDIEISDRWQERFAYIETELLWGNGITAGQISETFDISRQMAQRIINQYRDQHTGQMQYRPSNKRHEATDSFHPIYIRTSPLAFLDYLRGQALVGLYRDDQEWSDLVVTDVDRLLRPDLPFAPLKIVLSGLRCHKAVMIDYRKKDLAPDSISTRVISPNHLVFADGRYHVRAYCHQKMHYLDFVLSRIVAAEKSVSEDWVSADYDKEWKEFVELHFEPNQALSNSLHEAILKGFERDRCGIRTIKCRKALAYYVKRKLLVEDPKYGMPLWRLISEK